MNKEFSDEEIIFQVKINRKEGGFELAKLALMNDFEQAGLETYLRSYVETQQEMRNVGFVDDYTDLEE